MVSLGKALEATRKAEFEQALSRSVSRLIDGIVLHALVENDGDYSEFQKAMRDLQRRLARAAGDGPETLVVTGAILQALNTYNREIARHHAAAVKELRQVISMLTGALEYSCRGQERVSAGLRDLEKNIEHASAADDLRVVRANLETCLAALRAEIDRQEREYREARELAARMARSAAPAEGGAVPTDPLTHLPDRRAAREALLTIFETADAPDCGICLRLDRLPRINSTCGYEAGDEYLTLVSRLIGQALQSRGRLYRWSGPGFFVLAPDKSTADQLQRAVTLLNSSRDAQVLNAGARSIVVAVAISATRVAIRELPDIESFMAHVDAFVSSALVLP